MTGVLKVQGAETVQRRLLRYLQSFRVHPALLLVGTERDVKREVALSIARFHLCQNRGQQAFCGECSSCKRIDKGLHPDVLVYGVPEEGEEEEPQIKIELIREISHQMSIAPLEGVAKICIVDECHRMNTAAANAFLKTLEEPAPNRFFMLLTTQPGTLLPTILSRTLEFKFRPEMEAPPVDLEKKEKYLELLAASKKNRSVSELVSKLSEKEDVLSFLTFLQHEIRTSVLSGNHTSSLFTSESEHSLTRMYDSAVTLEGRLRSNANSGLMLEDFLRTHSFGA